MRPLLAALLLGAVTTVQVAAQEAIPERRSVVSRDVDFYGADLQALFDTTQEACERVCLSDPDCGAFTFNTAKAVCFPKTGVSERKPFQGAVSAVVVNAAPGAVERAATRAAELDFLTPDDLDRARDEAAALGTRHAGGRWDLPALLDAAEDARQSGNLRDAVHWTGAATAQSDSAAHWLQYSELSAALAESVTGSERFTLRDRAFLGAVNAYLRSDGAPQRQAALVQLADALEVEGRGRDTVDALRLAASLGARDDIAAALDEAVAQYGFRITDNQVEADSASPRICAVFSEDLAPAGVDYAPYVRLPDARLAVRAEDQRLCVSGLEHGARYTLTFRSGLPAASGEVLSRDVEITAYVRDRAPELGFPGRAYVLPRSPEAGLPLESVNADRAELVLRRVSDRNLLRAMQEDFFARRMSEWELEQFGEQVAEEVWRGESDLQQELNADMVTRLPVGELVGDMPAGIYALTARLPEAVESEPATQWFVLSDIGLTTLQGTEGLTVVARGLGDAGPRAGLEVTLLSAANRALGVAETDAAGVATFPAGLMRGTGGAAPALVIARDGEEDIAFLSLTDPAFDLSDRGVAGRAPAGPLDVFVATDRGAYRAGEVIHATVLARDAQAAAVEDVPLTAVLTRPDGVEYAREVSDGGVAGGHVFDLPVAESAPRGTWRLDVYADPEAEALQSQSLLVEDFVPERIDFDLTLPEGAISPLAPPQLGIDARYLFGAPGAGLPVEGSVRLAARDRLKDLPGWRFGRHDAEVSVRTAPIGEVFTDESGVASLRLPLPEAEDTGWSMEAEVAVRITEGSGRPVERQISRPVLAPGPMIGIRPGFDGTLPEGGEARFDLQAFGPDLAPVGMEVEWTINRISTRYQWYELYGDWNWEPVTTRETVARGTATLGEDPVGIAAPVDWGQYELVVTRADGAYLASSVGFDAGWYATASAPDSPDMLEMSLDREAYRPGDTAVLRMVPRYAGQALVTVMADRVVSMQAVEVTEGETTLELPVTDDWGAGVYVTAQVIRPMDAQAGHNPARSLGLAHASVDPGEAQLDVALEAPEEVPPRGAFEAAVRIDGMTEGDAAYVTVAAVDVGILNLTGFEAPDPGGYYFGQRRLGVEIRDVYGRLIDGLNGAMGQIRSGGDAAAGMRMQSPPPTEDLVAQFTGPVTVGADGMARVSFDMPDFNGTVRLMAVAWNARGVGSAETEVLVRDPVVMAANLPRFLAPEDEALLGLELTHAKGPGGTMALEVSAPGLDLGAVADSVEIAEGGRTVLSVPVTGTEPGDYTIEVALTTPGGAVLTKRLTLGVRANDPARGTTRRLSLAPGQSFMLDDAVLTGYRAGSSEVLVSAGPLARFDVPGLLTSLERYPYGCTEQLTSQALPLLSLASVAGPLGIGGTQGIDGRIDDAITQILTRQAANGAFGLWRTDSGDGWLDAYVSDFLTRAAAAGHAVPDRALQSALDNLANRIAYAADFDRGGEDIAYALMVLAREGRAAMGDLRYYADEKAAAFGTPLALAQLGAALASYGDQGRADRLFAQAAARLGGGGERVFRADYGSELRDTAGVLSLAVEAGSTAVDRTALAERLAVSDRPLSTQEQAWSLLAARAMVADPGISGISVDGTPVAGPFLRRIDGDALEPMQITNTSGREVALTLTTLGVPEGETEPGGYGYALERAYYTPDGEPADPSRVARGDRLVTVLTVRPAEEVRARLIVDDPLPAGFEIDNPSLLRSGDIRGMEWLETAEPLTAEFRTDRFLAALDWGSTDALRLAYVVRAVSPGRFHHPAALVEHMYRPEYRAVTGSGNAMVTE